ncbi:hypothetical protein [Sorangium sp. So ce388]|uniref:hypothetical protein n=1 Tax=Sorangium sp. So ce388 TaxID=3133309 RepID=UPI003F5C0F03
MNRHPKAADLGALLTARRSRTTGSPSGSSDIRELVQWRASSSAGWAVTAGTPALLSGSVSYPAETVAGAIGKLSYPAGTVAGAIGKLSYPAGTVAGAIGKLSYPAGTVAGAIGKLSYPAGTVAGAIGKLSYPAGTASGGSRQAQLPHRDRFRCLVASSATPPGPLPVSEASSATRHCRYCGIDEHRRWRDRAWI